MRETTSMLPALATAIALVLVGTPATAAESAPPNTPSTQSRTRALKEFKAAIREADPSRVLFRRVDANPKNPDEVLILVAPEWMVQPKALRLTAVESLQLGWSTSNAPNQPNRDRSSVVLLAPTGRKVGGSRTDRTATWVEVED